MAPCPIALWLYSISIVMAMKMSKTKPDPQRSETNLVSLRYKDMVLKHSKKRLASVAKNLMLIVRMHATACCAELGLHKMRHVDCAVLNLCHSKTSSEGPLHFRSLQAGCTSPVVASRVS